MKSKFGLNIIAILLIAVLAVGGIVFRSHVTSFFKTAFDSGTSLAESDPDSVKLLHQVFYDFKTISDLEGNIPVSNLKSRTDSSLIQITPETEYGPTYNKQLSDIPVNGLITAIEYSFYMKHADSLDGVYVVLELINSSGEKIDWKNARVESSSSEWELISHSFDFSAYRDSGVSQIKLYLWNSKGGSFYFDDLTIGFYGLQSLSPAEYVSLNTNGFSVDGKPFFPIVMNYMVDFQTDGNNLWVMPYLGYFYDWKLTFFTKSEALKELENQFTIIKQQGFNAVRVVGIGEVMGTNNNPDQLTFSVWNSKSEMVDFLISENNNEAKYINAVQEMLNVAKKCGLKVIFLARLDEKFPESEKLTARIASGLKDYSTLFAYDLFNEPLYFDSLSRKKSDVKLMTTRWNKIIKDNAPYHLTTIGMTGIREIFEWDPNMVEVDFLSFHPYEYEDDQVRNEMFWYRKYVRKPWIIGETGTPADGDSISHESQVEFARKTLLQSYACGALGYSWWQYMDVAWYEFHPAFMGMLTRKGFTVTSSGDSVIGQLKPVAGFFRSFEKPAELNCVCPPNYYNYSDSKEFSMIGKIVDKNDKPIEGAVILGYNEDWTSSYHTITKPDGTYELKSKFPVWHYRISATLKEALYEHIKPLEGSKKVGGRMVFDLGVKKLGDAD